MSQDTAKRTNDGDLSGNSRVGRRKLTRVSVEAERRSEIDWDRFAYALLQYTRLIHEGKAKPPPGKEYLIDQEPPA